MHLGENTVQPLPGAGREFTGFNEERHSLLLISEFFLPQKSDATQLTTWAGTDVSGETETSGEHQKPEYKPGSGESNEYLCLPQFTSI